MNSSYISWGGVLPQNLPCLRGESPFHWPFCQESFTSEIYTDIIAFQSSFCVTSLDKQGCYHFLANTLVNQTIILRLHTPMRALF